MRADYKDTGKRKQVVRKRTPTRRPSRGGANQTGSSKGWLWLLAGVLIGLFVAFLMYVNQNAPQLPPAPKSALAPAPKDQAAPAAKAKPQPQEAPKASEPKYGFYKRLEDQKVKVKVENIREERQATQDAKPHNLVLQVGSFRSPGDAETMKAQLAFLGFEARIVRTESLKHGVWHRLRLGPYSDKRLLQKDRATLYSNKIESLMITLEDE